MFNIFVLFISLIFLMVLELNISKDYYSPSLLIIYGYCISVFLCLLNYNKWGYDFKGYTSFCIILSVIVFWAVEQVCKHICIRPLFKTYNVKFDAEYIYSSHITFWILICLQLLGLVMLLREVVMIAGGISSSLAQLMYSFKSAQLEKGEDFSLIVSVLTKFTSAISFIYLYIFLNNIYYNKYRKIKAIKSNWINLVPLILGCIQSILKGNRLLFLSYPTFILIAYYLINNRYEYKQVKIRIKQLVKLIIILCLIFAVFFYIREFVGRKSDADFFTYISTYAGSSIANFNNYLSRGKVEHWTPFYEFVPGLINSLHKIGLSPATASKVLEYTVYSQEGNFANIYTGLRRMYNMSGVTGIVVGQILYSLLFCLLYKDLKKNKNDNRFFGLKLIIYCKMVYCLPLQSIEDQFFITNISIGYVIDTCILIILYYVVVYRRLTFGRR